MQQRNRDEFSESVIATLRRRVGDRCSNPSCRCSTSGPNEHPERASSIGVAAHITAAAPKGPRYDETLTVEARRSIDNGIWLCQNCARLVDIDPAAYPVDRLDAWRLEAEHYARVSLGARPLDMHEPKASSEGWICPFCKTIAPLGASVCLGCQAELVYGMTRSELAEVRQTGFMVGGGGAALLMFLLPKWLADWTGWVLPVGWGLGYYSILPVMFSALLLTVVLSNQREAWRRDQPPRFHRRFST
jgi:hypothetical protein